MAKVIILSGAGISAESGIRTFRDNDGLWKEYKVAELCSISSLKINRNATLDFYDYRRIELKNKYPNYAHSEIVKIKQKYPQDITLITQNVDNLFEKAGIKQDEIIHLHGYLRNIKCSRVKCTYKIDIGYEHLNKDSVCPLCKKKLRPDIVFFGEIAPNYEKLYKSFKDCEFFVVIGTSGYVINPNIFLDKKIKYSILNNLYPSEAIDARFYSKVLYKNATEAIDEIIKDIELFLK